HLAVQDKIHHWFPRGCMNRNLHPYCSRWKLHRNSSLSLRLRNSYRRLHRLHKGTASALRAPISHVISKPATAARFDAPFPIMSEPGRAEAVALREEWVRPDRRLAESTASIKMFSSEARRKRFGSWASVIWSVNQPLMP